MQTFLVLALLLLGEGLMIRAEVKGARLGMSFFDSRNNQHSLVIAMLLLGSIFLLIGYIWGYKYLENIWIVAAVSIGCILIIEPAIARSIFHEIPTKGALLGLGCGVLGVCFTLRS